MFVVKCYHFHFQVCVYSSTHVLLQGKLKLTKTNVSDEDPVFPLKYSIIVKHSWKTVLPHTSSTLVVLAKEEQRFL